ncbi:MAG TPA: caspase family protein [Flavobacteriales bacterium]|nr:caspase family protein [Flavobacteriales bacterium]
MKKLLFVFAACLFVSIPVLKSQTVDKLRLTFNEKEIVSKQVGTTVSGDGKLIAFAYANQVIKIVNMRNGKTLLKFNGNYSSLFEIRFNYNSTKLIAISDKYLVTVYDVETGKQIHDLKVSHEITKIAIGKINDYIAIGQFSSALLVYDLQNKKNILDISVGLHHISAIDFHPKKNEIAIGRTNFSRTFYLPDRKNVKIYNLETGENTKTFGLAKYSSMQYSPDGSKLYMCGIRRNTVLTVAKAGMCIVPVVGWIGAYFVPAFNNVVQYYDFGDDKIKSLSSKSKFNSNLGFTSMCIQDNYFLCSQDGTSFDVIDISTKKKIFTTQNDKYGRIKINFSKLGVGVSRIYPLADKKHFIINSFDNNIVRLYNIEQNSIIGYIFSDANDDFVTVGRDGRMDGSEEAIGKLAWQEKIVGKKPIPLESTFDKFFTPNLLAALLKGEKLEAIKLDISNLKPSPTVAFITPAVDTISFRGTPKISLETNQAALNLEFNSIDMGGGIVEIKVFQNGKLVFSENENIHEVNKALKSTVKLDLVPGDNLIKIVAVNDEKTESSKSTVVKYTGKSEEPTRLFVLAIGVNKYVKSSYDLKYAVPDATGFVESLKIASKDLFSETKVSLITDGQATKKNILAEVDKIKGQVKQGDVFIFYYAGHGTMTIAKEGEQSVFHLVPNDVTNFYSNEMVKDKGISADELRTISKNIVAQKQLFIFDACQSGGAVEAIASTRGALNEKEMANLARSTGTYFLTASASDQLAGEFASLGHGVFTYAILQGFTGKADGSNGDAKISVKELSLYVENAVPDLSEKFKGQKQFPVSYGYGQDFPVVLGNVYKMKDVGTNIGKYSALSLEELTRLKKEAVEAEDYDRAKELKEEIERRK